jgi:hypothetical protein
MAQKFAHLLLRMTPPIEVERNNAFDLPFANIDGLVEELGLWPVLAVPGPWEMPDLIPQSAL